eukprot:GILK01005894.1.p1 GENE.GILK01005894.1~~GILK01005894.1.p1  ORF type:complete len:110 (+),score=9.48 GILK01005894.1:64-393(+)
MPNALQVKFVNAFFTLVRSGKDYGPNKVVFKVPMTYTKPEIKQYLESIYNLKVLRVNTIIKEGEIKRSVTRGSQGQRYRQPDSKKAVITLDTRVPDSSRQLPHLLRKAE